MDADAALAALRMIRTDFASFCDQEGRVTEADTRAQVIDRILLEVCGWPQDAIRREQHVRGDGAAPNYLDYTLSVATKPTVVVEAKSSEVGFTLPTSPQNRTHSLSGALLTDSSVAEAVRQVRGYCDDAGVRFAIATNGFAWIIFRAVRDDMPWRKGHARVYASLSSIEDHFTEFWNLLSYPAIISGSLMSIFGQPLRSSREQHRVSKRLFNSDQPLGKNRLHGQLGPIIKTFFDDIGDLDQLRVLQSCYVYSGRLQTAASDLNLVISDTVPKLLRDQGTKEILQTRGGAGDWATDFEHALHGVRGELFLLLGGIGSGKTTFLRRYQRTVAAQLLRDHTFWFHVSFLGPPFDPSQLASYVYTEVLAQLRDRYQDFDLEKRKFLKRVFAGQISAMNETLLGGLTRESAEYERALSPFLAKWQEATTDYVPQLLRTISLAKRRSVVLFIDNVDQLNPSYQQAIFFVAQAITRQTGAVTVVALREESYYAANSRKTFTAYATRKFHIASPRFRRMMSARIALALDVLTHDKSDIAIPTSIELDKESIVDFLKIVEYSVFTHNKNIARMIEALCFGNMRQALGWFSLFLTSGATDVDKMLSIYRRDGMYFVPYHEFVKSIMLSEYRYYRDSSSPVLNLFECGVERNSSHFTATRVLDVLVERLSSEHVEGRGFVDFGQLVALFDDVFDNREDLIRVCGRLVVRQLIEVNTRSTETVEGASCVRVTSAGWYYLRYLISAFPYLDLVLQDTPLNDASVEARLRASVEKVDNLSDWEGDKVERLEARFVRVTQFIDYLAVEEAAECVAFGFEKLEGPLGRLRVPAIRAQFEEQRARIRKRIKENRERYAEDNAPQVGTPAELQAFVPEEDESDVLPTDLVPGPPASAPPRKT